MFIAYTSRQNCSRDLDSQDLDPPPLPRGNFGEGEPVHRVGAGFRGIVTSVFSVLLPSIHSRVSETPCHERHDSMLEIRTEASRQISKFSCMHSYRDKGTQLLTVEPFVTTDQPLSSIELLPTPSLFSVTSPDYCRQGRELVIRYCVSINSRIEALRPTPSNDRFRNLFSSALKPQIQKVLILQRRRIGYPNNLSAKKERKYQSRENHCQVTPLEACYSSACVSSS